MFMDVANFYKITWGSWNYTFLVQVQRTHLENCFEFPIKIKLLPLFLFFFFYTHIPVKLFVFKRRTRFKAYTFSLLAWLFRFEGSSNMGSWWNRINHWSSFLYVPSFWLLTFLIKLVYTYIVLSSGSDVITLILSNLKVERSSFQSEKEISISYGNKGNEVLFLVIQKLYFLLSWLC